MGLRDDRVIQSLKYFLIIGLLAACTTEESFPDMGNNFNGVVSIKDINIDGGQLHAGLKF